MDNSIYFEIVKQKYDSGKWPESAIRALVFAGRITKEEFELIVGHSY